MKTIKFGDGNRFAIRTKLVYTLYLYVPHVYCNVCPKKGDTLERLQVTNAFT